MLKPVKFQASAEPDCCAPVDQICNEVEIEVVDGGGGNYLVISTTRWALDDEKDIDKFAKELKNCLKLAS
jgi:hypothetical protein